MRSDRKIPWSSTTCDVIEARRRYVANAGAAHSAKTPMIASATIISRRENPLRLCIENLLRQKKGAASPAAPAGRLLAGRVEAGLRSLRGARLAGRTNLFGECRLAVDREVGAELLVRLIAEALHLH